MEGYNKTYVLEKQISSPNVQNPHVSLTSPIVLEVGKS